MANWTCSLHRQDICNKAANAQVAMEKVERFAFYRRAKVQSFAQIRRNIRTRKVKMIMLQESYAIVATGETALYGNIILKKGVIPPK